MPFNGSGSYSPPPANFPIINGTLGDADQVTAIVTDVATGLSTCLTKDGQQTVTANIPMNGFKFTGVAAGTSRTDTATIANNQDQTGVFVGSGSVGGSANAITLLPSPAIAAYVDGQRFQFVVEDTNTSNTVTVAVSGLAAKNLRSRHGVTLTTGDLTDGETVEIIYSASNDEFNLMGGGAQTQRSGQTLTSCVLSGCSVTAPPTTSLGVANKAYVDALWTTGDVKVTLKTTADSGWVMFDDGTIGSASSGATTRANADTEDLFTLIWNNTTNANCAVSGGRGTSAAADFAANKTIALPKVLGRALAIAGAGSGLTSRALAVALGAEDAVTVSHTHVASQVAHSHTWNYSAGGAGATSGTVTAAAGSGSNGGGPTSSEQPAITVAGAGVSGTGANMQPSAFLNIMVKL